MKKKLVLFTGLLFFSYSLSHPLKPFLNALATAPITIPAACYYKKFQYDESNQISELQSFCVGTIVGLPLGALLPYEFTFAIITALACTMFDDNINLPSETAACFTGIMSGASVPIALSLAQTILRKCPK